MAYSDIDSGKVLNKEGLLELSGQIKGYINTNIPQPYTLPTASTSTLGGVKVDGTTIIIADGVISAVNGSSGPTKVILPSFYSISATNISNEAKEVLCSVMKEETAPNQYYFVCDSLTSGAAIGYITRVVVNTQYDGSSYLEITFIGNPTNDMYPGNQLKIAFNTTLDTIFTILKYNNWFTADNIKISSSSAMMAPSGIAAYVTINDNFRYIKNNYATKAELPEGLPAVPTTDGTYMLKCVISSGTPTYSWEEVTVGGSY